MPVKFRTKPPERVVHIFSPDYPTRVPGRGCLDRGKHVSNTFPAPISDLMGPCGRVTPVHRSLPWGDPGPLSLHPLRGINWPCPLLPPLWCTSPPPIFPVDFSSSKRNFVPGPRTMNTTQEPGCATKLIEEGVSLNEAPIRVESSMFLDVIW